MIRCVALFAVVLLVAAAPCGPQSTTLEPAGRQEPVVRLANIAFSHDRATVSEAAMAMLDGATVRMAASPETTVVLDGHADWGERSTTGNPRKAENLTKEAEVLFRQVWTAAFPGEEPPEL